MASTPQPLITVRVLYADGTPVVGAVVTISWSYFGEAVAQFFGTSGPTTATATTNGQGYVYMGVGAGAGTTINGTVTSSGGDSAEFVAMTDSNQDATAIVTTTWQPLTAITRTISTGLAQIASFITMIIIIGIIGIIAYIAVKKVSGTNPLSMIRGSIGKVRTVIGY